ncbi:MAG: hypothetical protein Q8O92_08730 [Candidatus Latescibacter sp.]|nr:hypothetical protein [Candidatus Latescibacter sp.]
MRKAKTLLSILATAIMTTAVLALAGCQEKNRAASKTITSGEKPVATAPATDPRVIIAGFQDLLKPAGVPLTDKQQERIMEVFDPAMPYDIRSVFGVCTPEQKRVFVNMSRKLLAKSKYPFTGSQESRIMALGPGSKEKSWLEIFTPEQLQIGIWATTK